MSSWNSNFTPSEIRRQKRLTVARGNLSLTGFALIETIVALAILSLIFLDMAEIIKLGHSAGSKSKISVDAGSLARTKLEEYSQIPLPANNTYIDDYNTISGFPQFRVETAVQDFLSGWAIKLISTTVYWNSGANSVYFTTLKADY